jgi:predicted metal-dependent HD superfamily phosphohydrolase
MNWSRIQDTDLAVKAHTVLSDNELYGCSYHNGWHVKEMYYYLQKTEEPYDEALDWAVLFHDVVYDNQPDKEARSAEKFVEMANKYDGCNLDFLDMIRALSMIHSTQNHLCENEEHSAIIRADLHGLVDPVTAFYNYSLILKESLMLYQIDERTFADNNIQFMTGLYDRVEKNKELDSEHREFYKKVHQGIVSTINLSRILKGDL